MLLPRDDSLEVPIEAAQQWFNRFAEGLIRRATVFNRFVWKELKSGSRSGVPIETRLRWWRRGFLTTSGVLYDFDAYDFDEYVNDVSYFRRDEINGSSRALVDHKSILQQLLEPTYSHAVPDWYGSIRNGKVVDARGHDPTADVSEWLRAMVAERGRLVVKPENGLAGNDVFILTDDDGVRVNGGLDFTVVLDAVETDQTFLVVEHVEQHDYIGDVYPYTTNTVRLLTFWDEESDKPYVADAIHRVGTDDSRPVDNWDKGGLAAGIDRETGTLLSATRLPHDGTVEWFDAHPDTGVAIAGTSIPGWGEIVSGTLEMAEDLWHLPLIAWDVVVTDDGYAVIEANARPSLNLHQAHRPLLRDDRNRRFFERHGVVR